MSILNDLRQSLPGSKEKKQPVNKAIQKQISDEVGFWDGVKEVDAKAYPRLQTYWDFVKFPDWTPSGTPWSAAFVSYSLRGQGFPKTAAHWKYVEEIINNPVGTWQAYDIDKSPNLVLNVGDVLVKPRSGDKYSTHGDIVWRIDDGKAYLVGGNVSNTAKVVTIVDVDQNNRVLSNISPYMIILKKKGRPATLLLIPIAIGIGLYAFNQSRKPNV